MFLYKGLQENPVAKYPDEERSPCLIIWLFCLHEGKCGCFQIAQKIFGNIQMFGLKQLKHQDV
jgi:hypothetical protein